MSESKTWKAGNGTIEYAVKSNGKATLTLKNADIKVSGTNSAITLPAGTKVTQIILEGENTITTETGSALICGEAVSIVNDPEKPGGKLTLETTKDGAANAFLADKDVQISGVEVVVKRAKHSNLEGNEEQLPLLVKRDLGLQDKANLDVSGEVICVVGHISVNQYCKFNAEITYTGDADAVAAFIAQDYSGEVNTIFAVDPNDAGSAATGTETFTVCGDVTLTKNYPEFGKGHGTTKLIIPKGAKLTVPEGIEVRTTNDAFISGSLDSKAMEMEVAGEIQNNGKLILEKVTSEALTLDIKAGAKFVNSGTLDIASEKAQLTFGDGAKIENKGSLKLNKAAIQDGKVLNQVVANTAGATVESIVESGGNTIINTYSGENLTQPTESYVMKQATADGIDLKAVTDKKTVWTVAEDAGSGTITYEPALKKKADGDEMEFNSEGTSILTLDSVNYTSSGANNMITLPEGNVQINLVGENTITNSSDSYAKNLIKQGEIIDFQENDIKVKPYSTTIAGEGKLVLATSKDAGDAAAIDVDGTLNIKSKVEGHESGELALVVYAGDVNIHRSLETSELTALNVYLAGKLIGPEVKADEDLNNVLPIVVCYGNFTQDGGALSLPFADDEGHILVKGSVNGVNNLAYTKFTNHDIGDNKKWESFVKGNVSTAGTGSLFDLSKKDNDEFKVLTIGENSKLTISEAQSLAFTQTADNKAFEELSACIENHGTIVNNGEIVLELKTVADTEEGKAAEKKLIRELGKLEGTGKIVVKNETGNKYNLYTNAGEPIVEYATDIDLSVASPTIDSAIAGQVKWTPATGEKPAKLELGNISSSADLILPDGKDTVIELKGNSEFKDITVKNSVSVTEGANVTIKPAAANAVLTVGAIKKATDAAVTEKLQFDSAKVVLGSVADGAVKELEISGESEVALSGGTINAGTINIENSTINGNGIVASKGGLTVKKSTVTVTNANSAPIKAEKDIEIVDSNMNLTSTGSGGSSILAENGNVRVRGKSKLDLHCDYGIYVSGDEATAHKKLTIENGVSVTTEAKYAPVVVVNPKGESQTVESTKNFIEFPGLNKKYEIRGLLNTGGSYLYAAIVKKDAEINLDGSGMVANSGLANQKVNLTEAEPPTGGGNQGHHGSGNSSNTTSPTPAQPDKSKQPEAPQGLSDIQGHWAKASIEFAVAKGYMKGVGNNRFAPDEATTRAMVATILHNIEGKPQSTKAQGFNDVAGKWYESPVAWAAEMGIIAGYEDGSFKGDADITREQMAKLLYGYTMYKKWDTNSETDLSAYRDAASISGYAVEPMKWAVKNGIISGMTADTLEPQGKLTRAQMATMLERYTKKFVK